MHFEDSLEFAISQDHYDPLRDFRSRFLFPEHEGKPVLYFTGNSLGLQPAEARGALLTELDDWARYGVEGHFQARHPWFSYHEPFAPLLAQVVGALPNEVVAMGSLTNNLHLLLVSFYRPTRQRYKIICEQKSFPSDFYALDSQARFHARRMGHDAFDPSQAVVEVGPRPGETFIRPEDILQTIETHKDELALVMMGGVNYYTGQLFDMKTIAQAGHAAGAFVGFDLAHAAGNVALQLHDWDVDFAAWCSYKYLNSGPGSVAGIFVHERHHHDLSIPRFEGWWGSKSDTRFRMERTIDPFASAEAWQLSNAPVFSMAVHRASLQIFAEAGMEALVSKSRKLTGFLLHLIRGMNQRAGQPLISVITPEDPTQRGCQLSLVAEGRGREVFAALTRQGVVADWREPNVIRIAPVPLYNSFQDVYEFVAILEQILTKP